MKFFKQILIGLFLFLGGLFVGAEVSAAAPGPLPSGYVKHDAKTLGSDHEPIFEGGGLQGGNLALKANLNGDSISKERSLIKLIAAWLRFGLSILVFGAVIAVIYAGFTYVTGGGDDGRYDKAKSILIWVVVGLLVVLAAYAIVNTLITGFLTGAEPT